MGMEYLNWKAGKKGEKSAIAQDESLAEHDKKYHPEGFDPKKDECKLRETMAKEGEKDDLGGEMKGFKVGDKVEMKEGSVRGEVTDVSKANGGLVRVSWENGNETWEKGSDVKDSGEKKTDDGGKDEEFNAENLTKKIEALRDSKDWKWGDIYCKAYDFEDGTKGVGIEVHPYGNNTTEDYFAGLTKALGEAVGGELEELDYEDGVVDENDPDGFGFTEAYFYKVTPAKNGGVLRSEEKKVSRKTPSKIASIKRIAREEIGIPGPALRDAMLRKGVYMADIENAIVNTVPADASRKEIHDLAYQISEDVFTALDEKNAPTGYDGPHTLDKMRNALPKDDPILKLFESK